MRALSFKNEKGGLMMVVMTIIIIWIMNIFRIKRLDYLKRNWIKVK